MRNAVLLGSMVLVIGAASACREAEKERKPTIAFLAPSASTYWRLAIRGAESAAREAGIDLSVVSERGGDQALAEDCSRLLKNGVDGILLAPKEPAALRSILEEAAMKSKLGLLLTDLPGSKRKVSVSVNHRLAGRKAARELIRLVKEGGRVVWLPSLEKRPSDELRREGVLAELKGTALVLAAPPEGGFPWEGLSARLLATLGPDPEFKALVVTDPTLLVPLDEFLHARSLKGKIVVVAFDDAAESLPFVESGLVAAVVCEQPQKLGYEAIRNLAGTIKSSGFLVPDEGVLEIPTIVIDSGTVSFYLAEIEDLLKSAPIAR